MPDEPKGAPTPAPRPSTPQPRATSAAPAPRFEAVCYIVSGVAMLDLLASKDGDAGTMIHALQGRLHARAVDALLKAHHPLNQKAYEVRVTVEVLGEVEAVVRPRGGVQK